MHRPKPPSPINGLGGFFFTAGEFFLLIRTSFVLFDYYTKYGTKTERRKWIMEEIEVVLERHEQQIKTLERDMTDMKTVQAEIRSMHDTLVTLATELKHANEHLARHEQKIDEIKGIPGQRMQQIVTAIIAALAGGVITLMINMIFT